MPSRLSEIVHHPLSPFTKRAFYAIVVLAIVMAIGTFSIGAAISAITFTFGPLFGSALKEGVRYLEKEEERLKGKLESKDADSKNHIPAE